MKRLLSFAILLAIAMMAKANITLAEYQAILDNSIPINGIRYQFNETELTATVATIDSLMPDSIMRIPETISYEGKTYSVTAIGANAFGLRVSAKDLRTNEQAKQWNQIMNGLKKIIIPQTVKAIGYGAFWNSQYVGNTPTGSSATRWSPLEGIFFEGNTQLESFGGDVFRGTLVTKVEFESLKAVPDYCFWECESIHEITLPSDVETIGKEAFYHSKKYKDADGWEENYRVYVTSQLKQIGENAFGGYVVGWGLIREGQTYILPYTFSGNLANMIVYITENIQTIGAYAFANSNVTIRCETNVPPAADVTAFSEGMEIQVSYDDYQAYSQADVWKDLVKNEWEIREGPIYYSVTWPDDVRIVKASLSYNYFDEVVFADSITIGSKKLAVKPEIPEDILSSYKFREEPDRADYDYRDLHLKRIIIKTPVTTLSKLFGGTQFLDSLTSIVLPPTLKVIGDKAFYGLRKSENRILYNGDTISISIPQSVEVIGDEAFAEVPIGRVRLHEGLKSIGHHAFSAHADKEIALPASIETIGEDAFYSNSYVEGYNMFGVEKISVPSDNAYFKVEDGALYSKDGKRLLLVSGLKTGYYDMPSTLNQMDEHALSNQQLTGIRIPASITMKGVQHVISTWYMSSIDVADANPVYKSIDGVLFNHQADTLLRYPRRKQGDEYVVPNGVSVIGEKAFSYVYPIRTITLPNTVQEIQEQAFSSSSLYEMHVPNSVKNLALSAFDWCRNLHSLTFPDDLTITGYNGANDLGFSDCYNFQTLRFNTSQYSPYHWFKNYHFRGFLIVSQAYYDNISDYHLKEYGKKIFVDSDYLLQDGVEYLRKPGQEHQAVVVNSLTSVPSELTVPSEVVIGAKTCVVNAINNGAFCGNDNIISLSLSASVDSVDFETRYGSYGTFSDMDNLKTLSLDKNSKHKAIGANMFTRCPKLERISWPDNVDCLGNGAFSGDSLLSQLDFTLAPCINEIQIGTFSGCKSLPELKIPYVAKIRRGAFANCELLESVITADSCEVMAFAFYNCKSLKKLPNHVRILNTDMYNYYYDINPLEGCLSLTDHTMAEGSTPYGIFVHTSANVSVFTNSSDGVIYEDSYIGTWGTEDELQLSDRKLTSYPAGRKTTSFVVPEQTNTIGRGAFAFSQLESVTLPATLTSVSDGAFAFNHRLNTIVAQSEEPASLYIGERDDYGNTYEVYYSQYYTLIQPAFEPDVVENAVLAVPASSLEAYRTAEGWREFKHIVSIDELTGVQSIEIAKQKPSDVIYDLQGRRINRSSIKSGLYVVNGKKVMVR